MDAPKNKKNDVTVRLSDEHYNFIVDYVAKGKCSNNSECVRDAVKLWVEKKKKEMFEERYIHLLDQLVKKQEQFNILFDFLKKSLEK